MRKGIRFTFTTTNTPAHNGVAERMNGVLMEMARAMMLECNAPIRLWGEAMHYEALSATTPRSRPFKARSRASYCSVALMSTQSFEFSDATHSFGSRMTSTASSISFPSRDLRRLR